MASEKKKAVGKVTQVLGAVIDVTFPEDMSNLTVHFWKWRIFKGNDKEFSISKKMLNY